MFVALNANGQRVQINEAIAKNTYYCPVCNEKVIVRALNSNIVTSHFAHQKGTKCLDNWNHDMSEWHLRWQSLFPNNSRENVVEYLGQKHRADVLIDDAVFEFQHSPISYDDFVSRNNFYTSCGYKVVWLFDMTGKIKEDGMNPIKNRDKKEIYWKRTQNQFANFNSLNGRIEVYLQYKVIEKKEEVDCIVKTSSLSTQTANFLWADRFLSKENFLSEYGVINDENIESISEIFEISNKKEKNRLKAIERKKRKEYEERQRDRERELEARRARREQEAQEQLEKIRNKERLKVNQYPGIYLKNDYPMPQVNTYICHKDYEGMRIVHVELGEYVPMVTVIIDKRQIRDKTGIYDLVLDWKWNWYNNNIIRYHQPPMPSKTDDD